MNDMTSNDKFDRLEVGCNFIKITGMAEDIEGLRKLSRSKTLFRFVMNNGTGRRIRVLAFDEDAIEVQDKIKPNGIYSLTRLRCAAVNLQYFKEADGVLNQELHITSKSKVTKLGSRQTNPVEVKLVKMSEIAELFSVIRLQGFISDKIENDSKNSKLSCGSGAITDSVIQVQVNVFNILPSDEVSEEGTHVEVCGRLTRDKNYGLTYLQCSKMSDITKVDDEKMSTNALNTNFVSPQSKRLRTETDAPKEKSTTIKTDYLENINPNHMES
ncbi:uncharacterized protein LOC130676151 [Microplitis mediator]|uniref:uncharacterized protein LOC130676151 n=1 Tax=Microplitis mediator TaxID=375433 RepID=UPI002553E453|nr:uncharacterized protein LOC130676151 [Microplitis mediator]